MPSKPPVTGLMRMTLEDLRKLCDQFEQQNRGLRSKLGLQWLPAGETATKQQLVDAITLLRNDSDELLPKLGAQLVAAEAHQVIAGLEGHVKELQAHRGDASLAMFQAQQQLSQSRHTVSEQQERIVQLERANTHWQEQIEHAKLAVSQQRDRIVQLEQAGMHLQEQHRLAHLTMAHQQETIAQLRQQHGHASLTVAQQQERINRLQDQLRRLPYLGGGTSVRQHQQQQHPVVAFAKAVLQGNLPLSKVERKNWLMILHPDKLPPALSAEAKEICTDAAKLLAPSQ